MAEQARPSEALGLELELGAIELALGSAPRVLYEDVHVYPLSAPAFESAPGLDRAPLPEGPLKLYVHVPFCNYACTFCFYAKRVGVSRARKERYVDALIRELAWVAPGTPLEQLYVGGGTPTALPADLLDRALEAILSRLPRAGRASLTVECSPESLTAEHVRVLGRHGIDRVSMGIESLDDRVLATIGRRHGEREAALDALSLLIESGFFVNADLIYGLPGQSEGGFCADLEAVAARGPHSFTLYNLRLNEFTPLADAVRETEGLDLARLMRWRAIVKQACAGLGYAQTRWHTFVRPVARDSSYHRAPCVDGFGAGRQLGIGTSATSHVGNAVYRNDATLEGYLGRIESGASPVTGVFPLEAADRRTLFVARSLGDGGCLGRAAYRAAFGAALEDDFGQTLARLAGAGLVEDRAGAIALSEPGKLVYDLVLLAFYPERSRRWLAARQDAARRSGRRLAAD
jgi:oxygen-independent coproporphyrinogen III oxidase